MSEFLMQYPWLISFLQLLTIPWKGLALWLAAHRGEKIWFIVLLILNTLGILEIIYIFFIAKYRFDFFRKKLQKKRK